MATQFSLISTFDLLVETKLKNIQVTVRLLMNAGQKTSIHYLTTRRESKKLGLYFVQHGSLWQPCLQQAESTPAQGWLSTTVGSVETYSPLTGRIEEFDP